MVVTGGPSRSQRNNEDPKHTELQEPEQSPPLHSETLDVSDQTPPLASPKNSNRRTIKRKKSGNRKRKTKKIENLTEVVNPIPFIPKSLDLNRHEDVLKRLGLYNFSKIKLDRSIRTDLLVQLIVNYDSKKRCSYVNDKRVSVSRADLARALKLPVVKQDKASRRVEEVDLDSEAFSYETIGFIDDFVFNWVLLHEESWVMPVELVNLTRCIRDGHPEKLDSASLIWYKVEKELSQGDKLVDCYYASHLQYLIRSQHDQLLKEGDGGEGEENVKFDEEHEEKDFIVQEGDVGLTLGADVEKIVDQEVKKDDVGLTLGPSVEKIVDREVRKDDVEKVADREVRKDDVDLTIRPDVEKIGDEEVKNDDVGLTFGPDVEKIGDQEVNNDDVGLMLGPDVEKIVDQVVRKDDAGLILGLDVEKVVVLVDQEVRKDDETMVDAGECNEEVGEQVNWKNGLGGRILQRCQSTDLIGYEETKVEVEQIEQVEDEDDEPEEGAGEMFVAGFEMELNDDEMDRDGMTDNFPYGSHGVSPMDMFRPRDDPFMSDDGPSFFDNGGKRVMENEEHMHHPDGSSKRLKTNDMWDQKQDDFGSCMVQMQQWMEKAKMNCDSKQKSYVDSKNLQDLAMSDLQERHVLMQMIIKSRDEELKKKHAEVFRLERELYLMADLLAGYRMALNDTRYKFSEYRKRVALQEKPLFKDAGPGGLVSSTRELEKQRLKQEEDMMKFQTWAKSFEEECVYQLEIQGERALKMAERLVFVGNEVKKLKEIATQRKETQKPWDLELSPEPEENQKLPQQHGSSPEPEENQKSLDKLELSPESEENQKSLDKLELSPKPEGYQKYHSNPDNVAKMESVPPDA